MRCKACRHSMRPVAKPQFPVVLPILIGAAGAGGAVYLLSAKIVQMPVAAAVAVVTAVGGVLLAAMTQSGVICDTCGATEPMTPEEERKADDKEKQGDIDKMRDQIAAKLRPQIEDDLRPEIENELRGALEREIRSQVEDELRPQLAEELRAQFEEELRPHLAEQLRPQIEKELEARLRPEIERQLKAQLAQSARVAQPMAAPPPAARAAAAAPMSRAAAPAPSPARTPSGAWPTGTPSPTPAPAPQPQVTTASASSPHLSPVGQTTDPHARAQRRARVIVSDIALYHKDLVAEAVRANDPRRALDSIWEEAVRSYNESVPEDVRRSTNYLVEAFDAFIAQKRKEANL